MGQEFASGRNAIAICDVCGWQVKLKELRSIYLKQKNTNILACRECWTPDQPQLMLGEWPIDDPQALRNPRPDNFFNPGNDGSGGSRDIQWGWAPVGGAEGIDNTLTPNNLVSKIALADVTVVIS